MRIVPKVHRGSERYPEDVDRIVNTCNRNGYAISRQDAVAIWERKSEAWAAGWLILPEDDDELIQDILFYGTLGNE